MLYTDLAELKKVLEIDPLNTQEDLKLSFFIEQASSLIEEILDRDFTYKTRTVAYEGTGTQKLLLRHRPVYPNPPAPYSPIQVIYDTEGNFGQNPNAFNGATSIPLTYGTSYTLRVDQDDGSSRCAILYRLNDYWLKPLNRQTGLLSPFVGPDTGSYQITYTAGYTVDTLPAVFRWATNTLVARMRYLMPLGVELSAESYEERAIAIKNQHKNYLVGPLLGTLMTFRNWHF